MSTDNIEASNSTDTTTLDVSRGIEKVSIAGNVDVSRYDDISGTRSEEDMNSEKKCTSCEQNLEHGAELEHTKINDIVSNTEEVQTCANCCREGASNTCNKCKQVKYCNAACKKKHRHKHKKECEEHLR